MSFLSKIKKESLASKKYVKPKRPLAPDDLSTELTGMSVTLHEMKSDFHKFGFTNFSTLDSAITLLDDFCDEFDDFCAEKENTEDK